MRRAVRIRKFRGMSLTEALLVLMLGGVMISQGMVGIERFNVDVKVDASASKIEALTRAAERFSKDNYVTLMDAAPAEYAIAALEPYLAPGIGPDAFGNEYSLSTRLYTYTAADPATGTPVTKSGLQTLLVGKYTDEMSETVKQPVLRAKISGRAGAGAGFISKDEMTCLEPDGSVAGDGQICGAYGSFSLPSSEFPATDFSQAALVSLVSVGDSAYEEDYLMRYNYGDEELNSLRTDLYMDGNSIRQVNKLEMTGDALIQSETGRVTIGSNLDLDQKQLTSVNRIALSGDMQRIDANAGDMTLRSAGMIRLEPGRSGAFGANRLQLARSAADTRIPIISADRGQIQLAEGAGFVRMGDDNVAVSSSGERSYLGTAAVGASAVRSGMVRTRGLRALFDDADTRLEIQGQSGGEAIVGQARPGLAQAGDGTEFEVSDGKLVVGQLQAQNVLCEDCVSTSFGDYRWVSLPGGVWNPFVDDIKTYRNSSDYPLQVSGVGNGGDDERSEYFTISVREIGTDSWYTLYAEDASHRSYGNVMVPGKYDFRVRNGTGMKVLIPRSWAGSGTGVSLQD